MKKVLFSLATLCVAGVTLQAGTWSTLSGMSMKEVKPIAAYTIDSAGYNPRVYEWKTSEGKTCIAIFGNDKAAVAMQCTKK